MGSGAFASASRVQSGNQDPTSSRCTPQPKKEGRDGGRKEGREEKKKKVTIVQDKKTGSVQGRPDNMFNKSQHGSGLGNTSELW